ncbi:hypothetical protein F4811DRAFT_528811 [Daldinia bambusicola]|nr:hypothetical protein F4811DRAFT_528811 [Daldinia bambusicola]
MDSKSIQILEPSLTKLAADGPKVIHLYDFVGKTIVTATTNSAFWTHNPMKDPINIVAWLKFKPEIPLLCLGILPRWIAKEGLEAREVLVRALNNYLAADSQDQASGYTQRLIGFFFQEGIPAKNVSRVEVGGLIALNSNTIPMAF